MQVRPGIEQAGLSDVGCQRENNEDRFSYWEPASDEDFRRKGRLAIVADGMGGYEGGQEASRLAVEAIEQVYAGTTSEVAVAPPSAPTGSSSGDSTGDVLSRDPESLLLAGFQAAHHRIQEYAVEHPELRGMGTTCTAVALLDDRLYYAHVGDSRLYLVRNGSISKISHDHSYVSRLVEHGVISADEAESHPQRHILTAALGSGLEISPDRPEQPIPLTAGDVLILCTDGLWGLLSDSELHEAVAGKSSTEACATLVKMAKDRGGPDNITLQVLRIGADAAK
jgi:serine/threonine protein phosphatase PrpC